jgi:catechol 2,3-dioxygenase
VTIDPATSLANVELVVGDLDAQAGFYRDAIGLRQLRRGNGVAELGAPDGDRPLVTLIERPDAPVRPRGTTGLFHLALLVPDRAELARALNRVTATGQRFTGASDHLVSEALYLDDPEGNGIEIYRDRPREEWTRAEGQLQMATLPLDVEGVLASASSGDTGEGMATGTTLGHVHLQVASIPAADAFYTDGLGFDATVRGYPGALFVSAGGYHHHIGLNTWAGEGASAPPLGARGLRSYTIVLPDEPALRQTLAAAGDAGVETGKDEAGRTVVADPSGNRAVLATR